TSSWLPEVFSPRQFLEKTCVPHVPRFSFGEPLPVLTHSISDPNLPGFAYDNLAQLLSSQLSDAGRLIDPAYQPPRFDAGLKEETELKLLALIQQPAELHREIARLRQTYGDHSSELSEFYRRAATLFHRLGKFGEAEPMLRHALAIDEMSFGP